MTNPDTFKEDRMHNRLVNEISPYLLQHAYNPAIGFPGGEEAKKAKVSFRYFNW